MKGFYVLCTALSKGELPSKLRAPDRTWVDAIVCATRLHAVRFWAENGIVELEALHKKLALWMEHGPVPCTRPSTYMQHGLGEGGGGASTSDGATASPTPQAMPLMLSWRHEEDELTRAVMVSGKEVGSRK